MEAELAKVMAEFGKGANLPDALKGVSSMKFTQAAFHLRGVLNTIDAVLPSMIWPTEKKRHGDIRMCSRR